MALTWTDIRDLPSGEFSLVTQQTIEKYLTQAARWMDQSYWGDAYDDGLLNLAAHLLSQDLQAATNNAAVAEAKGIASATTGPFAVSFRSNTSVSIWDGLFKGTIYGQRYLYFLNLLRATPFMVF